MMWQWFAMPDRKKEYAGRDLTEEPPRPDDVPESWAYKNEKLVSDKRFPPKYEAWWIEPEAERLARRQGYCGLAGNEGYE